MIHYDPTKMLKKIAPRKKIERLVKENASLNRTALSFVNDIEFLDKKAIAAVALKTIKGYKKRIRADKEQKAEIVQDPRQLVQRVQNEIVLQMSESIRSNYEGEYYTWLPSSADEPDPEHQLNYGKVFQVGVGEMPGERYGCQCGMEIHVNGTKLELE